MQMGLLANGAGWADLTVIFIFIKDTQKPAILALLALLVAANRGLPDVLELFRAFGRSKTRAQCVSDDLVSELLRAAC